MFLANIFNSDNGSSDTFVVDMSLYFRGDKNVKNDSVIFSKGIENWDDQIYNLRACIQGPNYDKSIDTLVEFFKRAYQNTFSVKKRCISYYEYLDDTREKRYEDYRSEYHATPSETNFEFVIRGTDVTEFKKVLNCVFMTMEEVYKDIDEKGNIIRYYSDLSTIIEKLGGRSKLVDLVAERVKPFMKDLSEEDLKAMPWLGVEDIFKATEDQLEVEYSELPYYCW